MKKAIAILAVLVILVGAVFAAETHKIKIDANIATVAPQYQMSIGSVTTNDNGENGAAAAYTTTTYTENTTAAVLDFEQSSSVAVLVKLVNPAKTITKYTFTFSDGNFSVKKGADEQAETVSPKSIALTTTHANGTTGIASIGISGQVATVTFNGTTCADSTELVTATYSYDAHTDVNPGEYTAYVQMVVATL